MRENSQQFILFFLILLCWGGIIYFPQGILFLILSTFLVLIWKLLLGLSWVNFLYLLIGGIEINILLSIFHPIYLSFFVLILSYLLYKKIFSSNKRFWKYFLFHCLLLGWIILSLGLYFFNSFPFGIAFLMYLGGMIVFFPLALLIQGNKISSEYLVLILILGEFFWLSSYLSIKIPLLSLLLFSAFWALEKGYRYTEIANKE